jgi:hypothetical protein
MRCPVCQNELPVQQHGTSPLLCPHCGAALIVSPLYRVTALLLSFAASLAISYAIGVKAWAAILWIPLTLVALMVVPSVMMLIAPPRIRVLTKAQFEARKIEPWRRNLNLFFVMWFGLTFYLVTYGFVVSWSAYLLGQSPEDLREPTEMFSVPLAWVNSAFLIRSTTSLPAVFGIVFANCFFYAAALLAVLRFVQSRLRQPITQIGIFTQDQHDDRDS